MTKPGAADNPHPQATASVRTSGQGDGTAPRPESQDPATTAQADPVDEDADSFDKVPTVSNRTNPMIEIPPEEPTPGIGIYRMVRPTTPDIVTPPPATKPQKPNRLVIGISRK